MQSLPKNLDCGQSFTAEHRRSPDAEVCKMLFSALPEPQGLYDPAHEHDSCSVAVAADMFGPSRCPCGGVKDIDRD